MEVTNRTKFIITPVVVILTLLLAMALYFSKHYMGEHHSHIQPFELKLGAKIEDFEVRTLSDSKVLKVSQIPFKVLIINFWATWCQSCVVEMPSLQRLLGKYEASGLKVLPISLDETPLDDVPPMVKKLGIKFPIYLGDNGILSDLFDIQTIPLTVIVDKEFKILWIQKGEDDWDSREMHERMSKWLK
jgi:thiol-disulfide isomerase/thioredoxin